MGSAVKFKACRRADKSVGVFRAWKSGNHFSSLPLKNYLTRVVGKGAQRPMQFRLRARPSGHPYPYPKCDERVLASRAVHDAARGLDENMTNCWHQQPREEKYFGTHKICIIEKAPLWIIGGYCACWCDGEGEKRPKSTQSRENKKAFSRWEKLLHVLLIMENFVSFLIISGMLEGFSWDEKMNYSTSAKMWRARRRKPPPQIMFINTFLRSFSSRALAVRWSRRRNGNDERKEDKNP